MTKLLSLFLFALSLTAHAGPYEDTLAAKRAYEESPAYQAKVRAQSEQAIAAGNAARLHTARTVAAKHHRGLIAPLQLTYDGAGWIHALEMSCGDGFDCRCQFADGMICACVNRVTFETRNFEGWSYQ